METLDKLITQIEKLSDTTTFDELKKIANQFPEVGELINKYSSMMESSNIRCATEKEIWLAQYKELNELISGELTI